ncbi:MAG: FGGY-family carbohydrate kinase, partial [Treponema sp.]|nr:FGGY-family carbohydrate kinase [Treponema sp.]
LCPPEGDAGTGMVATNSITEKTGSISAGTSAFAMIVLEKPLSKVYSEIDIVLTPDGKTTALVHCNNCASDIDAWVRLFNEVIELAGIKTDKTALYNMLYNKALEANNDNDGLLAYNYYSGEHITGFEEGRPLFVRLPESNFTLANFMRTMLFSAFGTLKYGMNILTEKENVSLDSLLGHGGLFKVKGTAQRYMAAAFNTPVSVMEESAAEGGAWGIALLAAYMLQSKLHTPPVSLEQFLKQNVFKNVSITKIEPNPDDVNCFNKYMECYTAGLKIEQAAIENFK